MASQSFKKVRPIMIILENRPPFDSSDSDVMRRAGRVNATLHLHAHLIAVLHLHINKGQTSLLHTLYILPNSSADLLRKSSSLIELAKSHLNTLGRVPRRQDIIKQLQPAKASSRPQQRLVHGVSPEASKGSFWYFLYVFDNLSDFICHFGGGRLLEKFLQLRYSLIPGFSRNPFEFKAP